MIIAYYPGSGGNRYLQQLLGNEWGQAHKSYDLEAVGQIHQHRYLLEFGATDAPYVLTHCMNSKRIRQIFSSRPIVFINSGLKESLRRKWIMHEHQKFQSMKKTISRLDHYKAIQDTSWPDMTSEDQLDQLPSSILQEINIDYARVINDSINVPAPLKQLAQDTVDKINSSYEIITWHRNYYKKYPVDFSGAQQVVDIDNDNNEFCSLMKNELSLYQSEIFNQVWDIVDEQR
jgi:hypothetical protein